VESSNLERIVVKNKFGLVKQKILLRGYLFIREQTQLVLQQSIIQKQILH